jgi:hypothetical protein
MEIKGTIRGVALALTVTAGLAGVIGSAINPSGPGKTTLLGARTGTLVDGYGNPVAPVRPSQCMSGVAPFPDAPDAWWNTISSSVRQVAPLTGYRVWSNGTPPSGCPRDWRTEVYRGFYEFDLTPLLGRSGGIMKAAVRVNARATSVSPTSIPEPPLPPVDAFKCDNATAGAFQLTRVPPAVRFNNGFDVNDNVGAGTMNNAPRIPGTLPAGTVVLNFPTKEPSNPGTGSTPRQFEADLTRELVSTLQAFEALNTNPPAAPGFARMVFMMTGTNEPPGLKDAPLPFSDCRGAYSVELEIQEP